MIAFDARWVGPHGIGRFAAEVRKRLPPMMELTRGPKPSHPLDPLYLSWILRWKRPNLFFSPGYNTPYRSPVPFVFALHDLNHIKVQEKSSRLRKAYYEYVIRPACHHALRIVTVSEFSKHEIAEWAGVDPRRIIVVGNGVDPAFSPNGVKCEFGFPYLLYVGNNKPHKNLRRLLEAFASSGVAKDLHLVLSGSPDGSLRSLIARRRLEGRVIFVGLIPDNELAAYYRGAVALVFPSLYEGFGLPVLEAMGCGTPVLTSNVTSLPEVAGDAALLVDPYDVEAIADGLRRLVENGTLREELRQKALARANLFSWDRTAEQVRNILFDADDS